MATTLTATSLHDRVYEELRARLLTRRHVPGEKLSLHELAGLGVSRSPVHHALTRLVSEGLLTVKARRGYFVTPVTADALAEGYEVRLALGLHAADRAVGRVASRTCERSAPCSRTPPPPSRTNGGTVRTQRSTAIRSTSPRTRCCRASTASCP